MSVSIHVGETHEDPSDIAWRVRNLAGTLEIVVWLDQHGCIHASEGVAALSEVTPAMFVGVYKPSIDVRRIEEDVRAAVKERLTG